MSNSRKRYSRILLYAAAGVLSAALFAMPFSAYAAKPTITFRNLSKGKVIQRGASLTVKVKRSKKLKNKKIVWKSSNVSVASVSAKGIIKAKKDGVAIISATVKVSKNKKITKRVPIRVRKDIKKIKITNSPADGYIMEEGQKRSLKTKISPKDATVKTLLFKSSNKEVAKVSKKGNIKAVGKGTAVITVCSKVKPSVKKKITIVVGERVKSISINGSEYVHKGNEISLQAAVSNEGATNKELVWKSSNKKIAKVSKDGTVKGVKAGTATITASATDGSGKKASVKMQVFKLKKSKSHFIAHRGLNTKAPENTPQAFKLAGKAGFWGMECDIWEAKHEKVDQAPVNQAAADVVTQQITALPAAGTINEETLIAAEAQVQAARAAYQRLTATQKKLVAKKSLTILTSLEDRVKKVWAEVETKTEEERLKKLIEEQTAQDISQNTDVSGDASGTGQTDTSGEGQTDTTDTEQTDAGSVDNTTGGDAQVSGQDDQTGTVDGTQQNGEQALDDLLKNSFSGENAEGPVSEPSETDPAPAIDEETLEKARQEDAEYNRKLALKAAADVIEQQIRALPVAGKMLQKNLITDRAGVTAVRAAYDALDEEAKSLVRAAYENRLKAAEEKIALEESRDYHFDLVVQHDKTFKRMTGLKKKVRNVTASEAVKLVTKNKKNKTGASYHVCVLNDMLKICNKYGTVPVVEIKDSKMSDEAVRKLIDDLYSSKLLDVSWVISFHDGPLKQAITTAKQRYGVTLQTMRLITKDEDQSILSQVKKARKKGYTGVNLSQSYATEKAVDWAQDKGMRVGIWTYSKKKLSDLYEMIVENDPDFMTINGKLFDD